MNHFFVCSAHNCSVQGCIRQCVNINHFHGLDLIEVGGKMEPQVAHRCDGRHLCGQKCTAFGCLSTCTIDAAIIGHRCICDGHTGCRHPCWFSTQAQQCRNFCFSTDHIHEPEDGYHFCKMDHQCKSFCEKNEPCIWEGPAAGGVKKRSRKLCNLIISAGNHRHVGPHDCGGKHALAVQFSVQVKKI